jgi:hypothetical protein
MYMEFDELNKLHPHQDYIIIFIELIDPQDFSCIIKIIIKNLIVTYRYPK